MEESFSQQLQLRKRGIDGQKNEPPCTYPAVWILIHGWGYSEVGSESPPDPGRSRTQLP